MRQEELEEVGRKLFENIIPGEILKKTEKTSTRILSAPSKIRTGYIPKKSTEHYHYTNTNLLAQLRIVTHYQATVP
jgi:hypothetical protein